jgi:N-acetylglucosamine kinase-like BadF-type ATPase
MSFYMALDAGGTKTDYILADDHRELARVRSGTIKRMRADAATAARNLDNALEQLCNISGVPCSDVRCTCIGTAGQSVPLVADWLRSAFADRVAGELILIGDVEIALDAAFPGASGVLVLAGTGSNVAGRGEDGHIITAGGWGPTLSDQGSGYAIGHDALRSLFLAKDGGRVSSLFQAVLQFWKLDSIEALVEYANAQPSPDFSQLTGLVLRCAMEGDAVAAEVLRRQGQELAALVRIVLRRLQLSARQDDTAPSVAFAGSIMENVTPVRESLMASVRQEFPDVRPLSGVIDPIQGALWRARQGR